MSALVNPTGEVPLVQVTHREFCFLVALNIQSRERRNLKKKSVVFWGTYGVGKTENTATELKRQLEENFPGRTYAINSQIRSSNIESIDLRGLPDIRGRFVEWVQAGMLPDEERDGEFGILILDEAFLNPAVVGNLMELCGERTAGGYKLPDGWIVIALSNRGTDRSGVTRGNSMALDNRFEHYEFRLSVTEFIQDVCIPRKWDTIHIAYMAWDHSVVHEFQNGASAAEAKDRTATASPRSHESLDVRIQEAAEGLLPANLELATFAANVGVKIATGFIAFRELVTNLPDLAPFWANPETEPIPVELDVQWAMLGVMATQVDGSNFAAFYVLLKRFSTEEFVMTYMPMVLRDSPELEETTTNAEYQIEYAHQTILS